MSRRAFLAQVARQQPPNILLLLADNWAAPIAGALGDPVVQTPVFDRLSRDGASLHGTLAAKYRTYPEALEPDRWPAGDPEKWFAVGPYGDIDESRTKTLLMKKEPALDKYFQLGFAKRPAEELYGLRRDPDQTENRAADPSLQATKKKRRAELEAWMRRTADPRANGPADAFDRAPYYGPPVR